MYICICTYLKHWCFAVAVKRRQCIRLGSPHPFFGHQHFAHILDAEWCWSIQGTGLFEDGYQQFRSNLGKIDTFATSRFWISYYRKSALPIIICKRAYKIIYLYAFWRWGIQMRKTWLEQYEFLLRLNLTNKEIHFHLMNSVPYSSKWISLPRLVSITIPKKNLSPVIP